MSYREIDLGWLDYGTQKIALGTQTSSTRKVSRRLPCMVGVTHQPIQTESSSLLWFQVAYETRQMGVKGGFKGSHRKNPVSGESTPTETLYRRVSDKSLS